jgi:hypothetical protein
MMFRSPHPQRFRPSVLGGLLLASFGAPALHAQSADEMAFPRQILEWYLAGEGEKVWEHASPAFRTLVETPANMSEAGREILAAMGAQTGILDEQMFPHPEGGGHQVYVRTLVHAQVPEMFWIVIFSPSEQLLQTIMPQPRQAVRVLFPEVRVP